MPVPWDMVLVTFIDCLLCARYYAKQFTKIRSLFLITMTDNQPANPSLHLQVFIASVYSHWPSIHSGWLVSVIIVVSVTTALNVLCGQECFANEETEAQTY